MNKKELINKISEEASMTKSDAKYLVDTVFSVIAETLVEEGQDVRIPDFGVFKVKMRSERTGRNPKTGETVRIPAKKVIKFTPAKSLKESLAE